MSNIYLKVSIEKNWRFQNFNFPSLQNSSPGQLLRSSISISLSIYHWTLKLLIVTQKFRGLGAKTCVGFLLF